jgi:hypothetical protein
MSNTVKTTQSSSNSNSSSGGVANDPNSVDTNTVNDYASKFKTLYDSSVKTIEDGLAKIRSYTDQALGLITTAQGTNTQATTKLAAIDASTTKANKNISDTSAKLAEATLSAQNAKSYEVNSLNSKSIAKQAEVNATDSRNKAKTAEETAQESLNSILSTLERVKHAEKELKDTLYAAGLGVKMEPMTNLKEGFSYDTRDDTQATSTGNAVYDNQLLQLSEILTQKDNVANNILMDYIYKNEKGTNIGLVMEDALQINNDKKRGIEINTYYNKVYTEYINILKVIILSCIIIVPIIIANKNKIIPDIVSMFLTVVIIFLTIIYIFYKVADINMRDKNDFDKIDITQDREALLLAKSNQITNKRNPLTSLNLTCVGQDCCDEGTIYNNTIKRCMVSTSTAESFGNFFDNMNLVQSLLPTVVQPYSAETFANDNKMDKIKQTTLGLSGAADFYDPGGITQQVTIA